VDRASDFSPGIRSSNLVLGKNIWTQLCDLYPHIKREQKCQQLYCNVAGSLVPAVIPLLGGFLLQTLLKHPTHRIRLLKFTIMPSRGQESSNKKKEERQKK